jgi:hypothetical protein
MPERAATAGPEPAYRAALRRCSDYLGRTDEFLHLSMEGIGRLSRMGNLAHALAKLDNVLPERESDAQESKHQDRKIDLERLDRTVKRADIEVADGFPWLVAHTAVAVWAALEAYVDDVVVGALEQRPELRMAEPFLRIKAPVVVYESLSPSERAEFLAKEVARNTGADLKRGVGRFETLLGSVQAGGGVEKTLVDCLFELSQCRNLVVHRAGVVDRQFADGCSRLKLKPGDQLVISRELLGWYFSGAVAYAVLVYNRMAGKGREATTSATR